MNRFQLWWVLFLDWLLRKGVIDSFTTGFEIDWDRVHEVQRHE